MVRRGVSREMLTPLIYMKLSRHDRQVCYWRLKLLLPAHPEPSPLSFRSLRRVILSAAKNLLLSLRAGSARNLSLVYSTGVILRLDRRIQ